MIATPTFSPPAGSYSGSIQVTISCATAGASIYYTKDGSTPTTSSTLYTGPITVSSSETIKAIAALAAAIQPQTPALPPLDIPGPVGQVSAFPPHPLLPRQSSPGKSPANIRSIAL